MSQGFGSPGRKPGRPGGPSPSSRGESPERPVSPGFQQVPGDDARELPARAPQGSQMPQADAQADESIQRIEPSKRMVAMLIDAAAAYFTGVIVTLIPFIGHFLTLQIVMMVALLARDFLFGGRGVGKNLMGLRVVDAITGNAPTILQSVQRNIILLAPFVVLQTVPAFLRVIPIAWVNEAVMGLINIVGMLYVAIVLPLESYRAYSREDSLRIGDEFAGTMVVESQMDFSSPIQR